MKDLEKIKSEDLGCQVQDANPGNFAIEQEVAQLVGATVPAPTEPDDDDARELGAQLQVFLRRALLPIRSALRTALAAIYAHLDSRCTDYTPAAYAPYQPLPSYDPMGTPPTPRTLPNLLTAITAFSARKISNGSATADGIPDGVSLAHLLCSAQSVTKLVDDNYDWDYNDTVYAMRYAFPNATTIDLGCRRITGGNVILSLHQNVQTLNLTHLEEVDGGDIFYDQNYNPRDLTTLTAPNLKKITKTASTSFPQAYRLYAANTNLKVVDFPSLQTIANGYRLIGYYTSNAVVQQVKVENLDNGTILDLRGYSSKIEYMKLGNKNGGGTVVLSGSSGSLPILADIELKQGYSSNLNLTYWNPTDKGTTFLQNFKEHIALRLTDQGSGKTLTLSQAVFDTIWNQDGTPKSTDPDSVIYQINKIIKTDKHWSVNRA